VAAVEYVLLELGVNVNLGAGVTAAVQVLKEWK